MHKSLHTLILALVFTATISPPTVYGNRDASYVSEGRASVEVRSDVGWIGPGQTCNIIVAISPEADWHIYWKNPGASGAPTEFDVSAPVGFKVGEPVFPRPSIIQTIDGPTYGYKELAAIFIPVTAPQNFEDETATFKIITMWLACKKICVLGEQESTLTLSTNPKVEGPQHKDLRLSQWKKRLPSPIDTLKEGSCRIEGSSLVISGNSGDHPVSFIGVEKPGVRFQNPSVSVGDEGKFTLTVPLALDFSATDTEIIVVEGLLLTGRNPHGPSYVVRVNANAPH
jgi:DsbC/DsbD-like thiol-disulfide interchange protein